MSVASRLRAVVEGSGLQQKDVAYRAGIAQSSLSRLMTDDEADARLSTLLPIAKVLGVRIGALVDDGEPLPESPLTPYDTNPHYRAHIANLEAIDPSDREAILVLVEKYAAAVGKAPSPAKSRRPFVREPKTAETTDGKRPVDEPKRPAGMS